jgi:diphthamide biosynthesis protein 2
VLYVFGKEEVRLGQCVEAFTELFPDRGSRVLVLYDMVYAHCMAELEEKLSDYTHCTVSQLSLPHPITSPLSTSTPTHSISTTCECRAPLTGLQNKSDNSALSDEFKTTCCGSHGDTSADSATVTQQAGVHCYSRFGRCFKLDRPVQEYHVFYIGHEGQTLTNLMISYNKSQFYSYHPVSGQTRRESVTINKALGKRYFLVQKAKEARTVGILVGTLGAADSLKVMERLKTLLRQCGKKFYTIAVGKLNVAKMANFMEIDIFVLVACPENSLVESQEFYRPVVTPFEMEVACLR